MESIYTVYKTINKINGKYYIGVHKTSNPFDEYIGSGKYLKRAIEKYGIENFDKEILAIFDTPDKAFKLESELVTFELIESGQCYNLKEGGKGGFDHLNNDEWLWQKSMAGKLGGIAVKNKFLFDTEFKEIHSKRSSDILKRTHSEGKFKYDTFTGKKHSTETKEKIGKAKSIHQSGKGISQFGTTFVHSLEEKRCKRVKNEEVDFWIAQGWIKGAKFKW